MENNFQSNLQSLFSEMENFVSTKTVIGEPIHISDTIILPLVDVSFGVGAGASGGKNDKGEDKDSGGGGLGAKITPSAVLVIQNGQTQLINIKNQDSLNKLIDMIPGFLSKFNIDLDFGKKEKASKKDLEEAIGSPLEEYYEETKEEK